MRSALRKDGTLLNGYGSYNKAADGVIVQFVSATGERRTIVARGVPNTCGPIGDEGVQGSLLRAIAEMETWPGEWKVEVISTPATILTDLQGNRVETQARLRGAVSSNATSLHVPEPNLLSLVGRPDLLRIVKHSARARVGAASHPRPTARAAKRLRGERA